MQFYWAEGVKQGKGNEWDRRMKGRGMAQRKGVDCAS